MELCEMTMPQLEEALRFNDELASNNDHRIFHDGYNGVIACSHEIHARRTGAKRVQNYCSCCGEGTVGTLHCPRHGSSPQPNECWDFELDAEGKYDDHRSMAVVEAIGHEYFP